MSGTGYVPLPAPVTADPGFWKQGVENLNALRDQQAKQASADAYRQATDPATGQVDQARYNALISQGPGAWNAGLLMEQQGRAQGAQAQGSADQVAGRLAQLKVMSNEMSDLLQSGQPITADQIHARLNSLGKEGILTQTAMNGINADLNSQPPGADLTQWLRNHYATGLSASEALKNVTSQPQTVDQGDRKIVVEGNPNMPGGQRVGSVYTQGQAPPSLGTTVLIHYPDGHDEQVTPDQVQGRLGGNPGSFVISPGGGSGVSDPLAALPKAQALAGVLQRESGGQNVNTRILGSDGKPASSASGYYQMVDGTWLEGAALAGIKNPPPRAIMASRADQDAAASALYDKYGLQPWARSSAPRTASATPPPAVPIASTPPPAPPAGPPGVQMGGVPPPPPGGAAGPYTGGGIGAALAPGGATNPVVVRGTPFPAGRVSGDVGAMMQGMQLARANPLQQTGGGMVAGPGAPTGTALAGPSVELPPQPGWGSAVGTYGGGPAAPAPAARPAVPTAPPAVTPQPVAKPPAPAPMRAGVTPPMGAHERVTADIAAYTKNAGEVYLHQNNVNTLQNAYRALQLADTGPGTQNLQAARAFLQSFGIATSATGDQATQWAEAHKYLMDFARTQGGLGGTDLQAQLAQGSNASTDIPKPAALAVVRNNIAKERLQMAQVQEANGSNGYVEHTKNFAPSQDLRAYQADIMPPQELKQIEALQKTNPKAFEKFQKSLDIARAHGLISDEDLAAQNQRIRALGP